MELDELKNLWEQQTPADVDVHNKKIIDMIQNKSYGPLAILRNKYKKNVIFSILLLLVWGFDYIKSPSRLSNPLIGMATISIAISLIYSVLIFSTLEAMQNENRDIKENIKKKIIVLKKYYNWSRIAGLGTLILLLLIIEFMMCFRIKPYLTYWNTTFIGFRFLIYFIIIVLIYVLNKFIYQIKFEKHLNYLEDMLRQME